MSKIKKAEIFATEPDEGMTWMHSDWFYEIRIDNKRVGKLYKSRRWASRQAKKIANKIIHWYPF